LRLFCIVFKKSDDNISDPGKQAEDDETVERLGKRLCCQGAGAGISDIPGSGLLNGIELSKSAGEILIADSALGLVWKVDVNTGSHSVAIQVDEMKPPAQGLPMGINGIKIRDGYLYWTNTGEKFFCRIKIDEHGNAVGGTEILVLDCLGDDFVFDKKGDAWITHHGLNTVGAVKAGGGLVTVVWEMDQLTVDVGTACQFGRGAGDKDVLYVVTTGGMSAPVNGELTEGGKVVAVNTTTFDS
jgi:hypothetical protein